MQKFYVIKLVNDKTGATGFVIDSPDGITLSSEYVMDVKQFSSHLEAKIFIFDNKLEQKRTKAYIRSNEDIMDEGGSENLKQLQGDIFYIENESGEKIFFDNKTREYYFELREVGQCVWKTESDAKNFIKQMDLKVKTIIKKISQNGK